MPEAPRWLALIIWTGAITVLIIAAVATVGRWATEQRPHLEARVRRLRPQLFTFAIFGAAVGMYLLWKASPPDTRMAITPLLLIIVGFACSVGIAQLGGRDAEELAQKVGLGFVGLSFFVMFLNLFYRHP